MIYLGVVTRVSGNKIYVTIPELGGKEEFGALQMIAPTDPTVDANTVALATDSGGSTPHTHTIPSHIHTVANVFYAKDDNVVVAQLGLIKDNLLVLGRLL